MTTTKVAIVTGASSGIGEATARRLRGMGYTVYAAARRLEQMAPLAEAGIRPVRVDVTDDASLTSFVAQVIAPFGIHVVVIEPGAIRTEWSGIASDNLLATSGQGAYAGQAAAIAGVLSAADNRPRLSSPPEVIADAVARAVRARRPRTRYAVGMGAKPLIFARRVLPDRSFDRVMRLVFRLDGRTAGAPNPHRVPA